MPWYKKLHWQIIIGLVAGTIYGIIAAANGWVKFTSDWIAPWGTIFMNLLKLIAVPLVVGSLVTGVASLSNLSRLSRIGGKTIGIYVLTTAIAVSLGLVLVNVVKPGDRVPEQTRTSLQAAYAGDVSQRDEAANVARERGPLQMIVDIVPSNFLASASDNRMMLQVVFVALLFGVGLIQLPRDRAKPLIDVFDSLAQVVIRLVDLIMIMAPVGVFALIAGTITSVAGDDPSQVVELLRALGFYMATVIIGLGLHVLLTYGSLLKFLTPLGFKEFYSGIGPAQLVAFSTDRPRKARPPSATMATPMPSRARAPIGMSTLGRSSRTMMRPFLAPTTRAAWTNSRSAKTRVAARASRPTGATARMPRVRLTVRRLRPVSKAHQPSLPGGTMQPSFVAMMSRASTRAGNDSRVKKMKLTNWST